ncbi:MAG: glutaredoxin domain-containing protein [Candidatus Nanopelagicaceae bacterium]
MEVEIFTSTGCGYCSKMKELLRRVDLEYTEYRLGQNLTREEFIEAFPEATGYPRMRIDGKNIGGLTEAVRFFVENGMITSKRNQ